MDVLKKMYRYLFDADYRWYINAGFGMYNSIEDEEYLKRLFKYRLGYDLDLINPKTYNEKLQWIKLYDRNPLYTELVDKIEAKKYVAKRIGKKYIIPTIGIWDKPEDIDFNSLPNQFVLKCNHNSGKGMCICKDKSSLDEKKVIKCLKAGLKEDKYLKTREWPYKNVKRRILAEEYMEDSTYKDLRDYKFFCFNGIPKVLFVATERQNKFSETRFDFFDDNYVHLPIKNGHPNADTIPPKPERFDEMLKLAGILSEGIPHVRVDFYEVDGKVYFGEMTFFHWGGFVPFDPIEWDRKLGDYIDLPIAP